MAARLNPRHQELVRNKIKASQLINALQDHVLEGRKMAPSAVAAALGLLKKVLPDTHAIEGQIQHQHVLTYGDYLSKAPTLSRESETTVQ